MSHILIQKEGHLLKMGLNRPEKMNAFSAEMINQLEEAYSELENDPELRCGLLYSTSENFTAGLELNEVAPKVQGGETLFSSDRVDPVQLYGLKRSKPVVTAVDGYCLTIAIELILANDICIAGKQSSFGQIEIRRGIFPFGGATLRFTQQCGWGNAMRYLLTGDQFGAEEALRIGLVQQVTDDPVQVATAIANTICEQAPLGVQATLTNARKAVEDGFDEARNELQPTILRLMKTRDALEGVASFVERRKAVFKGE